MPGPSDYAYDTSAGVTAERDRFNDEVGLIEAGLHAKGCGNYTDAPEAWARLRAGASNFDMGEVRRGALEIEETVNHRRYEGGWTKR